MNIRQLASLLALRTNAEAQSQVQVPSPTGSFEGSGFVRNFGAAISKQNGRAKTAGRIKSAAGHFKNRQRLSASYQRTSMNMIARPGD